MIVARDWPLILGFLTVALVGFGLTGWLADRGKLAGPARPFAHVVLVLILGANSVLGVIHGDRMSAIVYALLAVGTAIAALLARRWPAR